MNFGTLAAVLGWIGAVLLIVAYWLVSTRRVHGSGVVFQTLNICGSTGLGAAAVSGGVWSAVTLNGIWVAIGVVVLARRLTGEPRPPIVGARSRSSRRAASDHREQT